MGGNSQDRITPPVDLSGAALETSSEVRRIVPLSSVPALVITLDQLRELPLDTRAGYLVSLIDGDSTVETIATISGVELDEVVAMFARLLDLGAIELRD